VFAYYTNELVESLIIYHNAVQEGKLDMREWSESLDFWLNNFTNEAHIQLFRRISYFNTTTLKSQLIEGMSHRNVASRSSSASYHRQCPRTCDNSSLLIWKISTGVVVSLTAILLLFFATYSAILSFRFKDDLK